MPSLLRVLSEMDGAWIDEAGKIPKAVWDRLNDGGQMNTKELLKVKEQILSKPKSIDMRSFFCGTAACIAGHVCLNDGWRHSGGYLVIKRGVCAPGESERDVAEVAKNILKLDRHQEDRLFYLSDWPKALSQRYTKALTAKTRAKVTAERIDLFIKSKGNE